MISCGLELSYNTLLLDMKSGSSKVRSQSKAKLFDYSSEATTKNQTFKLHFKIHDFFQFTRLDFSVHKLGVKSMSVSE